MHLQFLGVLKHLFVFRLWRYSRRTLGVLGAGRAPCFFSADVETQYYPCGDRLAVVDQTGVMGGVPCWTLRVLDMRPARARRAQLIVKGHPVWPAPPDGSTRPLVKLAQTKDHHHDWWYLFQDGPIRCDLPYIETTLSQEVIAYTLEVAMDSKRIMLNRVSGGAATVVSPF